MPDMAPLLLPGGHRMQVQGDARDLSVFGALRATDGVWEPHVMALYQRVVRPDWVCLDIGANLGVHTLALASLASEGQVIGFEAGSVNSGHLRANVEARPQGSASVRIERLALWDEACELHLAMVTQLAGCAFLSERGPEEDERLIRLVVDAEQVQRTDLEVTSDPVRAERLDDWVRAQGIRRIDLLKIDVEGAETHVLRGAGNTLRRYRPLVITEYNPACSATYWDQGPATYFELLRDIFDDVCVIESDGALSAPVDHWESLARRLEDGRGWEDLCCTWRRRTRSPLSRLRARLGWGAAFSRR